MTHHFLSLTVQIPSLLRHLRQVKATRLGHGDEGMLIKTALSETFGAGNWPKPFFVRSRPQSGSYDVLAYSSRSPDELKSIYMPLPSLADAVPLDGIKGYQLTSPAAGTELRFHITFCPMVRTYSDKSKGIKGRERDVYIQEIEQNRNEADRRDRMTVYRDYLAERLSGVKLLSIQPLGFKMEPIRRGKGEQEHRFTVPTATFAGMLRVTDPAAFLETVVTGIGRQRTYGFGMLLLGAAAPKGGI
jgi:CRISPR system Cascade subunit CasE